MLNCNRRKYRICLCALYMLKTNTKLFSILLVLISFITLTPAPDCSSIIRGATESKKDYRARLRACKNGESTQTSGGNVATVTCTCDDRPFDVFYAGDLSSELGVQASRDLCVDIYCYKMGSCTCRS